MVLSKGDKPNIGWLTELSTWGTFKIVWSSSSTKPNSHSVVWRIDWWGEIPSYFHRSLLGYMPKHTVISIAPLMLQNVDALLVNICDIHRQVKEAIEKKTLTVKDYLTNQKNRRFLRLESRKFVIVHLRKERFSIGSCSKMKSRNIRLC